MTRRVAAVARPRRGAWRLGIVLALSSAAIADEEAASSAAGHVPPAPPAYAMPEMTSAQMTAIMGMSDAGRLGRLLVDQWEWRDRGGARNGVWDAQGWYGDDYDKLWVRSEGNWPSGAGAQGRAELLWDRIVTRWWSLQAGARYDFGGGPGKGWAALGVHGLAPYWIDVEATVYAGGAGSLAARFKAEDDLRFTQRLILQPELELNAYSRANYARGQGAGLADVEAGLRLRYEFRRELAPYFGFAWKRVSAASAQRPGTAGDVPDALQWLVGVRFWY